jgi:hypothetical protein
MLAFRTQFMPAISRFGAFLAVLRDRFMQPHFRLLNALAASVSFVGAGLGCDN